MATLILDEPLTPERLATALPQICRDALPAFLPARRWFGDKARTIASVRLTEATVVPVDQALLALALVTVTFQRGDDSAYFVPLIASQAAAGEPIVELVAGQNHWWISDALSDAVVHHWLLTQLGTQATITGSKGRFRWEATAALSGPIEAAWQASSRVSAAQQSNTSIIYGSAIILKVFRRLQQGINPEVEIGRFLTTRTAFRHIPALLGEWSYLPAAGEILSLAVAQQYIQSVSDGWEYVLQLLQDPATAGDAVPRRLGEITAELHLALSSSPWDPAFAPEPITADDIAHWIRATTLALESVAAELRDKRDAVDSDTRELIETFLALVPRLSNQAAGYERLRGRTKIRVHGDYHLGQTLRTTADDFVILDFEGEPQRPIAERRAKTSPLKDVAGMLRSFSYARGVAERMLEEQGIRHQSAALIAWERAARRAFLHAYVAASRQGQATYLPRSDDDVRQAVAAWELDKALYEMSYELNNRPDWLRVPLSAVLKFA